MKAISEVMRKFGDEKSTLLDEYERITFEIQLNQAILARSLSEPGRRSTTQLAPPPLLAAGDTTEQGLCRHRRRRGYGFQKVMKKLLKPILGKMKGDYRIIETPPDPKDPRVEAAYDLLLNIKKSKIKPDLYTYTAVIDGFCKHIVAWGEIGAGLSIYKEMLNFEFEVDGMMVNSLLRGLCRLARKLKEFLEDAYQVFVKMRSRRLVIDPVGYELVIEAFCSGNKLDKAMECLYEIVRIGCSPKAFTFSNVIRVLCLEGDVDKAY
ncbi:hypothetical protein K7X08_000136 [Anisodus acutangulus]|uniref:Pentatricopeptide repeat-containing protein n=1 Tax=Anisodus acutangulus TaxID=402998 RepID=A0A9Q1RD84_9SOLA|nr:hypothetical protein K7X08_000136 [Anisodus acutangulus]